MGLIPIRTLLAFTPLALAACSGPPQSPATGGGPWISQSPGWVRQPDAGVAAASNGLVALVWIDVAASGTSAIGYAFSTDDGGSFAPPSVIASPSGAIASDPTVAVGADQAFYLSWVGYRADSLGDASDMHVYVARAEPGATTFGSPVEVTDPADLSSYDKPWIKATSSGSLVVTYQRTTPTLDVGVVMARSQDGMDWDRAFVADDPSGTVFRNLAYACAAPGGGPLWVTYLAGETTFDARLARSDDGGATWASEILVSAPGDPVAFDDPSCMASGDDVWVAYGLTSDPPYSSGMVQKLSSIVLARSSDAGASIASRADVQDASAALYAMHPQLAGEAGGAMDLVYYAGGSGDDVAGSFRRSHAASAATGFASSVAVDAPIVFLAARDDPRWVGDYPGVFTLGGTLYMGYVVNTSGDAHVAFAEAAP